MKNRFRRVTAILLLLCTLCSFAVPATFAEDEANNPITYDFKLYNNQALIAASESGKISGANFNTYDKYSGNNRVYTWLFQNYGTTINWGVEDALGRSNYTGNYGTVSKNFDFRGSSNQGLRLWLTNTPGNYAAVRIKVPAAGTYDVTVEGALATTPATNLDMYIFPATTEYTAQTVMHNPYTDADTVAAKNRISTYLTAANKIGTVQTTAANLTCQMGQWNFAAEGDYIVVFQVNASGIGGDYAYLSSLTLTKVADYQPEGSSSASEASTETSVGGLQDQVYDLKLYNNQALLSVSNAGAVSGANIHANNAYNGTNTIHEWLFQNYGTDAINWGIEDAIGHPSNVPNYDLRTKNFEIRGSGDQGLRLRLMDTPGNYAAIRIKVPDAGTYEVIVDGSNSSYLADNLDTYIFPATTDFTESTVMHNPYDDTDTVAAENQISTYLTEANKIGTVHTTKNNMSCNLGRWDFAAAGDYIVVFQVSQESLPGNNQYVCLGKLTLAAVSGEEPPTQPSTEAPTEETTKPFVEDREGFYNLALYNNKAFAASFKSGSDYQDNDYTKKCYVCGKPLLECFAEKYAKGELNWLLEGMSFAQMRFMAASDQGIRLRYNAGTTTEGTGNWVAFRLKVDKAGEYTISVGRIYQQAMTGSLYIFPATTETMSQDALTAATVEGNLAGAFQFAKGEASAKAGQWTFETAGEYIFLLKATGTTERFYLGSIELNEVPQDQPITPKKENIYDFDMASKDAGFLSTGLTGRYNNDAAVRAYMILEKLYAEDKIQWKYESVSPDAKIGAFKFEEGRLRYKNTTNVRELSNQWYAFRIKNPGTATYDIRLASADKSKVIANIYMIPANTGIMQTPEQIQSGMTKENLLVKGAIIDDKGTFYLGEYTFGMKEEYILVFEFTKGTLLYLNQIRMTLDDTVADGTVKTEKVVNGSIYNFALADSLDGYLPKSKYTLTEAKADMLDLWRSGKINWRFESSCDYLATSDGSDLIRFYRESGMRIYNQADSWSAYRIKSPGSGEFTLSLNHALQYDAGTIAVYILPGDTKDVEKAMDPSNRVGKVAFYNDDGSTEMETGVTNFVGYWNFEAGKEYIVVFEAYEASPYKNVSCYVNISQLIAERGRISYQKATEEKKVKPVTITKQAVPIADALHSCIVTEIYGHDYYFLATEGGIVLVYDLDTAELIDTISTGYSRAYQMHLDAEGIVWIAGSSKYFVRYDPYTQETFRTRNFIQTDVVGSGAHAMCTTPDGRLWFVTFGGTLGYYEYERDEYTVLEVIKEGAHPSGMLYLNGYLYFNGNNNDGQWILKYDPETGKRVGCTDITEQMNTSTNGYLNNMCVLGDGEMIIGGTTGSLGEFIAINPETMELITDHGLFAGMNCGATEIIDGKQYFICHGLGLYQYDVQTKQFSKAPGFGNSGVGFKSAASSLVTLDGEEFLISYSGDGGHPRLYNLETKEIKTWDSLVTHSNGAANIHSLTPGEEGDERLYLGAYNTPQYAIYDIKEGKIVNYIQTGGQGDSGLWYNGIFYTGNYSSTTINEIPVEEAMPYPAKNEIVQRVKLDHEVSKQKRIHTLAAGDGYVFAGSIPDTGNYGGSLVVYNTEDGKWYYDREAVGDLSVTKVAYTNKVLYAATSTEPGTNTTSPKPEGLSAVIVAYDYENKQVLGKLDPRDYIKGLPAEIPFISGLEVDPMVEGRLWAVVAETLFCFTFDKETGKFDVQEVLSFSTTNFVASSSRNWWNRAILFDMQRNCLYFSFDTNGGFQCITIADWSAPVGKLKAASTNRLMGDTPVHYTMGHDGEIYYGSGEMLKMLPLNITDEDWAIAEEVDKMITSLGEITLESEAAVKSARSAYENLSWRYKALVQNLELLKEAEADLLECQIDTIVLDDVTADSLPDLQVYQDTYKSFENRYKLYVKNYDFFLEAYNKATSLNNERVAKALQDRINALKEKFPLTLENEQEVISIRKDYDGLTGPQRALIDLTILEDAEAQIKALRAELVKLAEELIQAIPDEITLDAEPAIEAAREVVEKLYTNELKQISYAKFDKADAELRSLKNAKAAAEEVDALIDAIGIVTLGDKDRIAEARRAYDALNENGLSFLQNGKKLMRAEFILKALQTWGIPAIVVVIAGSAFAVVWFVPSLRKKVFKTKKKEETPEG